MAEGIGGFLPWFPPDGERHVECWLERVYRHRLGSRSMVQLTRLGLVLFLFLASNVHAAAPAWEVTVDRGAKPTVDLDGAPIVAADFVFWGAEWKYAPARFRRDPIANDAA